MSPLGKNRTSHQVRVMSDLASIADISCRFVPKADILRCGRAPHRGSGRRVGTESVCRNVKRWQNTATALRWTAAA
jgi:hypothetical protein